MQINDDKNFDPDVIILKSNGKPKDIVEIDICEKFNDSHESIYISHNKNKLSEDFRTPYLPYFPEPADHIANEYFTKIVGSARGFTDLSVSIKRSEFSGYGFTLHNGINLNRINISIKNILEDLKLECDDDKTFKVNLSYEEVK